MGGLRRDNSPCPEQQTPRQAAPSCVTRGWFYLVGLKNKRKCFKVIAHLILKRILWNFCFAGITIQQLKYFSIQRKITWILNFRDKKNMVQNMAHFALNGHWKNWGQMTLKWNQGQGQVWPLSCESQWVQRATYSVLRFRR